MTHRTDCSVKDEYREGITEIAELFERGDRGEAHERCVDLGWTRLGKGASRVVYATDPGDPETEGHPCVVKFALPFGQFQNVDEVRQYARFPDELSTLDGGNLSIVPISDWHDEHLWLSAPMADADGGDTETVGMKLAESGWTCQDIRPQNVGLMHGESVLLDYGLECAEVTEGSEAAEALAKKLTDRDAEDVDVMLKDSGGATIKFRPPPSVVTGGHPVLSSFDVGSMGSIRGGTFNYGAWPADEIPNPPIRQRGKKIAKVMERNYPTISVSGDAVGNRAPDRGEVKNLHITMWPAGGYNLDPLTAAQFFDRLNDAVEEYGGGTETPEDVEGAIERELP